MRKTRRKVSVMGHSAKRKVTCYRVRDNKNNYHAHLRRFSQRTVPFPPRFDAILFTSHQNWNVYIFPSRGSFWMDEEGQKIENSVRRTVKRKQKKRDYYPPPPPFPPYPQPPLSMFSSSGLPFYSPRKNETA